MQRSFSTFPAGWPGVGLLLLRSTVGVTAILQGWLNLNEGSQATIGVRAVGLLAVACGASLLIGLLTPLTSVLVGLGGVSVALSWLPTSTPNLFDSWLATIFVSIMAATIVFLGPGAFSLDCFLFGRREIVIPPARRS